MTGTWRVALAKAVLAALGPAISSCRLRDPHTARPVFEDAPSAVEAVIQLAEVSPGCE